MIEGAGKGISESLVTRYLQGSLRLLCGTTYLERGLPRLLVFVSSLRSLAPLLCFTFHLCRLPFNALSLSRFLVFSFPLAPLSAIPLFVSLSFLLPWLRFFPSFVCSLTLFRFTLRLCLSRCPPFFYVFL